MEAAMLKTLCSRTATLLSVILIAALWSLAAFASHETVPRITKEEAVKLLDDPDVVFIDARLATDWRASEFMIKGAVRIDIKKFDEFMEKYPTKKTLIFYCA